MPVPSHRITLITSYKHIIIYFSVKVYASSVASAYLALQFCAVWNVVIYNKQVVITGSGTSVVGNVRHTALNRTKFFSFQGIPYAAPPVNGLRFKSPQPLEKFKYLDATRPGNVCPQVHVRKYMYNQKLKSQSSKIIGNEDCLYLNVYTPANIHYVPLKPVMFFIHGGAFMTGSGDNFLYGPDFLIEQDVILVTINYRLGALGFLSLRNERIPGNSGLKDQVFALKWVKQNIEMFGGNPNDVTVFGQEAGAASAGLLMVSPLSQGLFHKVICQSGSLYNGWALMDHNTATKKAYYLAESLKDRSIKTSGIDSANILLAVPAHTLARSSELTQYLHLDIYPDRSKTVEYIFSPIIERRVEGEEAFLLTDPEKLFEAGNFTKIPLMLGHTDQEFLIYKNTSYDFGIKFFDDYYNQERDWSRPKPDSNIPSNEQMIFPWQKSKHVLTETEFVKLKKELSVMYHIKTDSINRPQNVLEMNSDIWFTLGIEKTARTYANITKGLTYFYQFSYRGAYNIVSRHRKAGGLRGVTTNGDELCYQFKCKTYSRSIGATYKKRARYAADYKMIRKWTKLLTNFAKTGNPTPQEDQLLDKLIWKPWTKYSYYYLEIKSELKLKQLEKHGVFDEWLTLLNNSFIEKQNSSLKHS